MGLKCMMVGVEMYESRKGWGLHIRKRSIKKSSGTSVKT